MRRLVRYMFVMLVLIMVASACTGCGKNEIFGPQTTMYCKVRNPDQYRWLGAVTLLEDPNKVIFTFDLNPRYELPDLQALEGSTYYHVKCYNPGGYNVREYDIFPNSVQADADPGDGSSAKYDCVLNLPQDFRP